MKKGSFITTLLCGATLSFAVQGTSLAATLSGSDYPDQHG